MSVPTGPWLQSVVDFISNTFFPTSFGSDAGFQSILRCVKPIRADGSVLRNLVLLVRNNVYDLPNCVLCVKKQRSISMVSVRPPGALKQVVRLFSLMVVTKWFSAINTCRR